MRIVNIHERKFDAPPERVGALIDSLASADDALWPLDTWPRMKFDQALGLGAAGGHGPIRYVVEEYTPGRSIRFRFTAPEGFDGFHGYEVTQSPTILRHVLEMTTHGPALVSWPAIFRPMHDALIEDSLATAQVALGEKAVVEPWSRWVKVLRWVMTRGKARPQRRFADQPQAASPH